MVLPSLARTFAATVNSTSAGGVGVAEVGAELVVGFGPPPFLPLPALPPVEQAERRSRSATAPVASAVVARGFLTHSPYRIVTVRGRLRARRSPRRYQADS